MIRSLSCLDLSFITDPLICINKLITQKSRCVIVIISVLRYPKNVTVVIIDTDSIVRIIAFGENTKKILYFL